MVCMKSDPLHCDDKKCRFSFISGTRPAATLIKTVCLHRSAQMLQYHDNAVKKHQGCEYCQIFVLNVVFQKYRDVLSWFSLKLFAPKYQSTVCLIFQIFTLRNMRQVYWGSDSSGIKSPIRSKNGLNNNELDLNILKHTIKGPILTTNQLYSYTNSCKL